MKENLGGDKPKELSADNGYFSEDNVTSVEKEKIEPFIATGRQKHGEKAPAPSGRIPKNTAVKERMARKLRTLRGRGAYKKRKEIVEPVFGQIKGARGFWIGAVGRFKRPEKAPGKTVFFSRTKKNLSHGAKKNATLTRNTKATQTTLEKSRYPDRLLCENIDKPIREATVHCSAGGKLAIRQGNWVLIDAPSGDDNKEPDWLKKERGYESHSYPGELYDLSKDISERRNLYGERPEKSRELKALLEKYKKEGRSAPQPR